MFGYRLRFTKEQNLKYLSHLELMRTMERALRRGKLPLAYSEGFHPHPLISFGPALAVGISSNDEYFDLELTQDEESEHIKFSLNHNLPAGLRILAVAKIRYHVKPLNAIINRAAYIIRLNVNPEDQAQLIQWLTEILQTTEFISKRTTKEGQKSVNIRPWLHNLTTEVIKAEILEIHLIGEIGSGGNLRPEDIINNIPIPIEVLNITRTALWHEENSVNLKPLDYC